MPGCRGLVSRSVNDDKYIRVRRKPSFSHLQRLFHASTPFKNAFQRQSTARIRIEQLNLQANQIQHQPRVSRRPAAAHADADADIELIYYYNTLSPTTTLR
jgi:hypothetical protein